MCHHCTACIDTVVTHCTTLVNIFFHYHGSTRLLPSYATHHCLLFWLSRVYEIASYSTDPNQLAFLALPGLRDCFLLHRPKSACFSGSRGSENTLPSPQTQISSLFWLSRVYEITSLSTDPNQLA